MQQTAATGATGPAPVSGGALSARRGEDDIDFRRMDRPTVIRNREERVLPDLSDGNTDYLDIPAFLRRQAD